MPRAPATHRLTGRSDFLRGRPRPISWRLEVREGTERGFCLPDSRSTWGGRRAQRRLASYISAGGMRDMQPAWNADSDTRRRHGVVAFAMVLLAFWILFFFVPCT